MTQRLLILDDDEDILPMLVASLSDFEVRAFSRGLDAVIAIFDAYKNGTPFDCLLIDCALPHFDGFTITKIVRLAESTQIAPKAKIAVITAYPKTVEQSTLFEDSGADEYLRKPEDVVDLPLLLNEWLCGANT